MIIFVKLWVIIAFILGILMGPIQALAISTATLCETHWQTTNNHTAEDVFINFAKKHLGADYQQTMGENWEQNIKKYLQKSKWTAQDAWNFLNIMVRRASVSNTLKRIKHSSYLYHISPENFFKNLDTYDKWVGKEVTDDRLQNVLYKFSYIIEDADFEKLVTFLNSYLRDPVLSRQLVQNMIKNNFYSSFDLQKPQVITQKILFLENYFKVNKSTNKVMESLISKHFDKIVDLDMEDFSLLTTFLEQYFGEEPSAPHISHQIVIMNFDKLAIMKSTYFKQIITEYEKIMYKDQIRDKLRNDFDRLVSVKLSQLKKITAPKAGNVFIKFAKEHLGKDYKQAMGKDWEKNIKKNLNRWSSYEAMDFLTYMAKRIGIPHTLDLIKTSFIFTRLNYTNFVLSVKLYDTHIGYKKTTDMLKKSIEGTKVLVNEENFIANKNFLINYFGGDKNALDITIDIISSNAKKFSYLKSEEFPEVVFLLENYFAGDKPTIETKNYAKKIVQDMMIYSIAGFSVAQKVRLDQVIHRMEELVGIKNTKTQIHQNFYNIAMLSIKKMDAWETKFGRERLKEKLSVPHSAYYNDNFFQKENNVLQSSTGDVFIEFAKEHLGDRTTDFMGDNWENNIKKSIARWPVQDVKSYLKYMTNRIGIPHTLRRIKSHSYFDRGSLQDFFQNIELHEKYIGVNRTTKKLKTNSDDFLFRISEPKKEKFNQSIHTIKSFFKSIISSEDIELIIEKHYSLLMEINLDNFKPTMDFFYNSLLNNPKAQKEQKIKIKKIILHNIKNDLKAFNISDPDKKENMKSFLEDYFLGDNPSSQKKEKVVEKIQNMMIKFPRFFTLYDSKNLKNNIEYIESYLNQFSMSFIERDQVKEQAENILIEQFNFLNLIQTKQLKDNIQFMEFYFAGNNPSPQQKEQAIQTVQNMIVESIYGFTSIKNLNEFNSVISFLNNLKGVDRAKYIIKGNFAFITNIKLSLLEKMERKLGGRQNFSQALEEYSIQTLMHYFNVMVQPNTQHETQNNRL